LMKLHEHNKAFLAAGTLAATQAYSLANATQQEAEQQASRLTSTGGGGGVLGMRIGGAQAAMQQARVKEQEAAQRAFEEKVNSQSVLLTSTLLFAVTIRFRLFHVLCVFFFPSSSLGASCCGFKYVCFDSPKSRFSPFTCDPPKQRPTMFEMPLFQCRWYKVVGLRKAAVLLSQNQKELSFHQKVTDEQVELLICQVCGVDRSKGSVCVCGVAPKRQRTQTSTSRRIPLFLFRLTHSCEFVCCPAHTTPVW